MTRQQYYNKLVESALDGTFPSMDEEGCWYRKPDGKKCAIGILIPIRLYEKRFDLNGLDVGSLPEQILTKITPEGMLLGDLQDIQTFHDECSRDGWYPRTFINSLNDLACFDDVAKAK